jgi:ABC-2 type transport system permease protein
LTYRAAALAGLITNFFFGLMRVAVLLALYGERQAVEGYTVAGIITYTALGQAVIAYLSLFGWYDLMQSVYTGEVAMDLLKPMRFFSFWMAQDLGRALVNMLLRGVTIMALYALIFDLAYPETAVGWLALLMAIGLSWALSFAYRFLLNLAAFWTPNATGVIRFGFVLSWFFSGFLMPLRFLPAWVQGIAYLTPFPHMVNTVVEIYLGALSGWELVGVLALQAAWVGGMVLVGQLALRRGVRRLVILGG